MYFDRENSNTYCCMKNENDRILNIREFLVRRGTKNNYMSLAYIKEMFTICVIFIDRSTCKFIAYDRGTYQK